MYENNESFPSSFQSAYLLLLFLLSVLERIPRPMVSSNDVGSGPCLVPNLKGKAVSVSPQNMLLIAMVGFFFFFFSESLLFLSFLVCYEFYHEWMPTSIECFFCNYSDDPMLLKDLLM